MGLLVVVMCSTDMLDVLSVRVVFRSASLPKLRFRLLSVMTRPCGIGNSLLWLEGPIPPTDDSEPVDSNDDKLAPTC